MKIMLKLLVFASIAFYAFAASIPQQAPLFPGPCAVLPGTNGTQITKPDGVQSSAADLWGHEGQGGPHKWDDLYIHGLTVVPYCFPTEAHRKANVNRVEAAIAMWMDALGGAASEATGHKILVHEWKTTGQWGRQLPRYCIDVNSPIDSKWTMKVPYQTAAIWSENNLGKGAARSTVGMGERPGRPWGLDMWLTEDATVTTIAHKFGHIMGTFDYDIVLRDTGVSRSTITGMMHEHQRSDRSTHVRFDCLKLVDYSTAIAAARVDDPSTLSSELCFDARVAQKYSFSGQSFVTTLAWGGHHGWTLDEETPYDVNSIMHYHSYFMGNEKCQHGDQAQCPLAVYLDSTAHEKGFGIIPHWTKPSQWDAAWVKKTYGWTGCAACTMSTADIESGGSDEIGYMLEQAREEYIKAQV